MGDSAVRSKPTAAANRIRLFDVASGQGGYFTTKQARDCGFSRALLVHHVKSGRFLRARRGLYRLREYPSAPREDVLAAWMAVGGADVVVSHDSALELLGLSDVIPDAVHLTVPRSRRNLPSLPGVRVHTTSRPIPPSDRAVRNGIPLTTATRSILDSAAAGTAAEQIEMAITQAVDRGQATQDELRQRAPERGHRVATLVANALDRLTT